MSSADMGDPTGEENRGRGHVKVGRRVGHGPAVNEIADMIEGHKDHHGPTNRVDRLQAPCGGCGRKVSHCALLFGALVHDQDLA